MKDIEAAVRALCITKYSTKYSSVDQYFSYSSDLAADADPKPFSLVARIDARRIACLTCLLFRDLNILNYIP